MRVLTVLALALVAVPARASVPTSAQTSHATAMQGASAAPVAPAAPAAPAGPASGASFTYAPDGRRDPFQSLIGTGGDPKAAKPTAAGIAGIRVDELSVRGIMQSRERLVAMVNGPDNRTYLIHQGDKLADGVVKSITPQGLVLVQDVSDPRAKEKTREVRKLLRSSEDEKE